MSAKYVLFTLGLFIIACSSDNATNPDENLEKEGFGVSGLLFENNLVMWYRENDGSRSELFPQMYFTRADIDNFPVWGTFPTDLLVSGGVSRDGIPALTNPEFVSPGSAELDYLLDSDVVLGAVINGEAKAYPENVLWWHEIINDVIGGVKIIMSFCPLTGTGMLFRSPDNGNTIDQLELLPVVETTWEMWKELYPETKAISGQTGFNRDYTLYPYTNYRSANTSPLFPLQTASLDERFPTKHMVLGLIEGDVQKAYPFSVISANPVNNDVVNGREVLVISNPTFKLAIPYDRTVDGQALSFELASREPFRMTDNETGSIWNMKGEAISGSLFGAKLKQIPAYNAFWFAWAVFWPQTLVFGE